MTVFCIVASVTTFLLACLYACAKVKQSDAESSSRTYASQLTRERFTSAGYYKLYDAACKAAKAWAAKHDRERAAFDRIKTSYDSLLRRYWEVSGDLTAALVKVKWWETDRDYWHKVSNEALKQLDAVRAAIQPPTP